MLQTSHRPNIQKKTTCLEVDTYFCKLTLSVLDTTRNLSGSPQAEMGPVVPTSLCGVGNLRFPNTSWISFPLIHDALPSSQSTDSTYIPCGNTSFYLLVFDSRGRWLHFDYLVVSPVQHSGCFKKIQNACDREWTAPDFPPALYKTKQGRLSASKPHAWASKSAFQNKLLCWLSVIPKAESWKCLVGASCNFRLVVVYELNWK